MAKQLCVVTMPATIKVLVEIKESDGDEVASDRALGVINAARVAMPGVLLALVGDAKVAQVASPGDKTKVKASSKSEPEEEEEKEEEEEEEEEDEDEPEEEEEEEEEDEKPKKSDKKADKKSDDGKKKIKIKLKG